MGTMKGLKGESLDGVYAKYGIKKIWNSVGFDWDWLEARAYDDAMNVLAVREDGELDYFGVQMGLGAALIDRGRTVLEWEDLGSVRMRVSADVIVFKDYESWKRWEDGEVVLWGDGSGINVKECLLNN